MVHRVVVFIDYQNVYRRARDAFGLDRSYVNGQVDPLAVGSRLSNLTTDHELVGVRVYRGMPSPKHDPVGHAAAQRQVARWRESPLVTVITRPLNYRAHGAPQEKGIDVQMAVDFVTLAMQGFHDLGILFTADSDLDPAAEAVGGMMGTGAVRLANWWDARRGAPRTVRAGGGTVYTHILRRADYVAVHDPVDYAVGTPRKPRPPRTDASN